MQTIGAGSPSLAHVAESQGIILQGDNISSLSLLEPVVKGDVRCVYMDPPYRNGESYREYDDTQTHEQWLTYMASLLPRVWSVLSGDGSIWISIDDAEMAYLKVLCDVCFGRESHISTIVWEHRTTRENRAAFSHNHEYILVYAKDPDRFRGTRNKIPAPELTKRYKNPDSDPRGPWQSVTATAQAGHAVASQYYDIVSPTTGKVSRPPKGRCWVYAQERMHREIEDGRIWFGPDGNGVPRIKKYLADSEPTVVSGTLWTAADVGTATSAKKQMLKMFPEGESDVFATPKPEGLLQRILMIATNPGDLVLDPFLGSGTTAAVAHKTGRRYVGIDSSPASIEYACRRLQLVVDGDQSGISPKVSWHGGGSFRSYALEQAARML